MRRRHEYEECEIDKNWTRVTLNCWPDDEIENWLKNHNSTGEYIQSYFALTWHFEYEHDALLFKLKFGSHNNKKMLGGPFGTYADFGSMDINSMYPASMTIKIMKNRNPSKKEFEQQYMCTFDIETIVDDDLHE